MFRRPDCRCIPASLHSGSRHKDSWQQGRLRGCLPKGRMGSPWSSGWPSLSRQQAEGITITFQINNIWSNLKNETKPSLKNIPTNRITCKVPRRFWQPTPSWGDCWWRVSPRDCMQCGSGWESFCWDQCHRHWLVPVASLCRHDASPGGNTHIYYSSFMEKSVLPRTHFYYSSFIEKSFLTHNTIQSAFLLYISPFKNVKIAHIFKQDSL